MNAVAFTFSAPVEVSVAPLPTNAVELNSSFWIPTEPATLAVPLPPAAARPQTTKSFRLPAGVIASTVIPLPLTVAPLPIEAEFVTTSTFRPIAAPTAVSDLRSKATPIDFAVAPTRFVALTFAAPPAETTTPPPIVAVFVCRAQLTLTDAAMATPPLCSPDLSPDELWPWSVESSAFGRLPFVLPFAFGLSAT
jgi:hypothetical protein